MYIDVMNTKFKSNHAEMGAALSSWVEIYLSILYNVKYFRYGGGNDYFYVEDSIFETNSADYGGCIYMYVIQIL